MPSKEKKKKLTPKQKRFVSEYLKDQNGTQAAIRAGYSKKTAQQQSSDLLLRPLVCAAVELGLKKVEDKAIVSAAYVLTSLKNVSERCQTAVPVEKFDYEEKRLVQVERENPETGEMVGVWEFDSAGANKALELLGKHLQLFTEVRVLQGPNGGPIQTANAHTHESPMSTENLDDLLLLPDDQLGAAIKAARGVK